MKRRGGRVGKGNRRDENNKKKTKMRDVERKMIVKGIKKDGRVFLKGENK